LNSPWAAKSSHFPFIIPVHSLAEYGNQILDSSLISEWNSILIHIVKILKTMGLWIYTWFQTSVRNIPNNTYAITWEESIKSTSSIPPRFRKS